MESGRGASSPVGRGRPGRPESAASGRELCRGAFIPVGRSGNLTLCDKIALMGVPMGATTSPPAYAHVLSPAAVDFVLSLERRFGARRRELLAARAARQARLDSGERPDFLKETAELRRSEWTVAKAPADLLDRRVEITGPPERKMVINALNSGAKVFMADFEDSHAPVWEATLAGQANLMDAVRRTVSFKSPEGKEYRLKEKTAVLLCRPRGWHLEEKHLLLDGRPVSGSFFDFGLYFFHNAKELLARGSGPYFYLPKMESHLEARLWNDVFLFAQESLGVPRGSVRATVLIETLLAAFEMDEILFELREHSAGLNCGRWDYIFSFIKKLGADPACVMPDRAQVGMTSHFLRSYSRLLIETCHRRGAHAMGGMAAQIPIKDDPAANEAALAKVLADKEREAGDGHDGTWVAHPGLVPVAAGVFDRLMPAPNQLAKRLPDLRVAAADLLAVPSGTRTEEGLRSNLSIGVQYLAAWLSGNGCVPLKNLMEDAATAEISRAQVWQWVRHGALLSDGRPVTAALARAVLSEEVAKVAPDRYAAGRLALAAKLFEDMFTAPRCVDFLTVPAYAHLD
ncbi:MAG: malate synthase [Elusimicrobia bacterium]|nr:MAG: malate synthase [Elusimicrobiota bacterium]